MAATPPPPKRIRTPPTPLHGAQHDSYEPYSPRRSTRIAKLHGDLASPNRSWNSASSSSAAINSARSASGTFSPPQSPLSPIKRSIKSKAARVDTSTPRKHRRVEIYEDRGSESEATANAPGLNGKGSRVTKLGAGMLPTPSKTPKKREVPQDVVHSTSRVLFPGRPANLDDAMPPMRRSKKNRIFSLDGLAEDGDDESGQISIYTDSKDRVPDVDEGDDNPFLTKPARGKKNKAVVPSDGEPVVRRSRRVGNGYEEEVEEMERRVRNDEGMIYVFRGRKVFRRFDDAKPESDSASPHRNGTSRSTNDLIKRKAGAAASERFTRSSVTPRLLFPNAEQQREREERVRREEEEAITDIEVYEDEIIADEDAPIPVPHEHMENADGTPDVPPTASQKAKVSPFAAWQRTKSGVRAPGKGTKREREVETPELAGSGTGKRVRSDATV